MKKGETRVAQAKPTSPDRILYLVPAYPAVSETFVYREIAALQGRGKQIGLCALYNGEDGAVGTPDLDFVEILYDRPMWKHVLSSFSEFARHPWHVMRTKWTFLGDFLRAGLVTRHAAALAYQFVAAASLARVLRKRGIQHIHAHFAHSPTQVAMYAAGFAGIGFSFTGHANDIYERGVMLREKADRATRMVTISDFNRRYLLDQGVRAEKVSVVRAILEFPHHAPVLRTGQRLKLGSLGRLVGKKGMDTLLAGLALLEDAELARISVEIGGDGPQRELLEELAKPLRTRGAGVTFLGQMPPEDVSRWMQGLDAFVLACRQTEDGDVDGIPVVLMEAVATGIPVISTSVSGVTELIAPDTGGLIGQPDSPGDIARNIRTLMQDPETGLRLAQAAQSRLTAEFDPQKNIDRLIETAFVKGPAA